MIELVTCICFQRDGRAEDLGVVHPVRGVHRGRLRAVLHLHRAQDVAGAKDGAVRGRHEAGAAFLHPLVRSHSPHFRSPLRCIPGELTVTDRAETPEQAKGESEPETERRQKGQLREAQVLPLPGSVVEIFACATQFGARVLVFKQECECDESDSEEESLEDESEESDCTGDKIWSSNLCSSVISNQEIPSTGAGDDSSDCNEALGVKPIHVNITTSDFYVIAILNTNRHKSNEIGLHIALDRSRYTIQKSGHSFDMCSLSTSCTIGLSFASSDRALIWIPDEPNAGRSTFVVRSQCKPRLAVFAILSVFFPLMVFLGVAFVVRADRERIMRIYNCRSRLECEQECSDTRFVIPLLDNGVAICSDFTLYPPEETPDTPTEEQPPAYNTLFDPPPPYACVKEETTNK
ncbi:DUF4793 domain-containing protein [Caerostris extrusa]|uniref:DUF4793 domain-containing protein n=1 Tax=Caerostris extrusa TaxID=172846 RepID=A0AAV4Y5I2_CAEEX|nr:DUF4793 domain-containing protein [Caerostris extrusa]